MTDRPSPTVYMPTIRQMRYLVALEEEGSFGRAADRCSVSQASLSHGIAETERLLGVVLVERNRRTVRFTALGSAIAEQARGVLGAADRLAELVRASGAPLTGDMTLSVIPTIAPFLLPALVPAVRRDYPDLRLFLREEMSESACQSLASGRADCVLLAMPYECGDVDEAEIGRDRIVLAAPAGDPCVSGAYADLDAIDPARMLMLEDGHCLRDHGLSACSRADVAAGARMIGTSLHTLVQMVAGGIGATLLPEMSVRSGILDGTGIRTAALESPEAFRTLALVWRRGSPRERDFRLLAAEIRSVLEGHSALGGRLSLG